MINVKVEEMAEDVVVVLELEAIVVFVKRLKHLLCSHGCWWHWWSNFENLNLDVV